MGFQISFELYCLELKLSFEFYLAEFRWQPEFNFSELAANFERTEIKTNFLVALVRAPSLGCCVLGAVGYSLVVDQRFEDLNYYFQS